MKKTLDVTFENIDRITFLMSKINFIETERIATGGMHSTPSCLITFEGSKDDYHEKGYIVRKSNKDFVPAYYYSIKDPNGSHFNTFEEFLKNNSEVITFDYNEL